MDLECTFRKATLDDAGEIARLSTQLGYPANAATMRERLATILRNAEHLVLVAEQRPILVAWIHACRFRTVESGLRLEIAGFVVDEGHRRRGVGRALVERVEDWGVTQQAPAVRVRCNIKRSESHQFYEALGYKRIKTQIAFEKPLSPVATA